MKKLIIMFMVIIFALIYIKFNTYFKENSGIGMYGKSTPNYINVDTLKEEDKIDENLPKEEIVYDGLTMNELAEKINKSLNSTIADKGYLIASHSIDIGVDPYMATAIILQETGCKWDCSYLVKECNNVGGQKGIGCGSYNYFPSIDDGIISFIDNLYYNYISLGLKTPEEINIRYAEDTNWSVNVNNYIEMIKAQ